ncbi:uncharacterized protein LOC132405725 [Hypanus sabinus]|uniref:uncharacterized protein LOC132405725 n=1 Tax=Hypanus sabinus TaxID=79690 RepID=UPI0028C5024B|nr:uncharacterized protein LOC132405725 [Hypanus sabinus]
MRGTPLPLCKWGGRRKSPGAACPYLVTPLPGPYLGIRRFPDPLQIWRFRRASLGGEERRRLLPIIRRRWGTLELQRLVLHPPPPGAPPYTARLPVLRTSSHPATDEIFSYSPALSMYCPSPAPVTRRLPSSALRPWDPGRSRRVIRCGYPGLWWGAFCWSDWRMLLDPKALPLPSIGRVYDRLPTPVTFYRCLWKSVNTFMTLSDNSLQVQPH